MNNQQNYHQISRCASNKAQFEVMLVITTLIFFIFGTITTYHNLCVSLQLTVKGEDDYHNTQQNQTPTDDKSVESFETIRQVLWLKSDV